MRGNPAVLEAVFDDWYDSRSAVEKEVLLRVVLTACRDLPGLGTMFAKELVIVLLLWIDDHRMSEEEVVDVAQLCDLIELPDLFLNDFGRAIRDYQRSCSATVFERINPKMLKVTEFTDKKERLKVVS